MKKFFESLSNVWKIEELKNRILITLGLLLVYRFGAHVTLPGIDATQLNSLAGQTEKGIGSILDMFTGGAFSKASVFALGIMPYISASIVVQLMGIAIPYLQKLQSDGESGRKKINQITRWLTIVITLVQGPTYIYNLYRTLPGSAFLLGFTPVRHWMPTPCLVPSTTLTSWHRSRALLSACPITPPSNLVASVKATRVTSTKQRLFLASSKQMRLFRMRSLVRS